MKIGKTNKIVIVYKGSYYGLPGIKSCWYITNNRKFTDIFAELEQIITKKLGKKTNDIISIIFNP